MSVYTLKNVKKIYNQRNVALDGVDLKVQEGEIMVILGPSGSGKSTLLNVLSGLDYPTSGEIYYYKEKLNNKDEEALAEYRYHNLGFIFQSYNLMPTLTAFENIELGKTHQNDCDIEQIMRKMDLIDQKDKYPYQLSGGQMQRVAIARSLIKNPKVIFCDEPTGALDEKIGKIVLEKLQNINETQKTTIVLVTHNPSIAQIAHTVVKMNSGKIVEKYKNNKQARASELRWV